MLNIQMRLINTGSHQMFSVFCRNLEAFVVSDLLSEDCLDNQHQCLSTLSTVCIDTDQPHYGEAMSTFIFLKAAVTQGRNTHMLL